MGIQNILTSEEKELVLRVASLIEQGSEGMEQITGHYFSPPNNHKQAVPGCCAMGALNHALGIHSQADLAVTSVCAKLGIDTWPRIAYPKVEFVPFAADEVLNTAALPDVVIFLNDRLGWSFDKIVNYLRDITLDKPTLITLAGKRKGAKRGKVQSQG